MKKILFVVDERMMGGVSIVLENILTYVLNDVEIDLLILSNNGTRLVNLPENINYLETDKFFNVIDISLKNALKSKNICMITKKLWLIFLLKTGLIKNNIKKLRKKLLSNHYDVEVAFKDGFCTVFTGYGDSDKRILWVHGDYGVKNFSGNYPNLIQCAMNNMTNIVSLDESLKPGFINAYGNEEKLVVINNYINIDNIIKKSNELDVLLSNKKLNFITVIRFDIQKGVERIINSFDRLSRENKLNECHLTMIGDGPLLEATRKEVSEKGLGEYISILGRKENPFPYIRKADLFILPSYHEAYPTVVIESLTLGVPLISTEVTAIRNMLKKTEGLIVENSEEGIYQGLNHLISNPEMIDSYKEEIKKYNYVFNNDRISEQIRSLILD